MHHPIRIRALLRFDLALSIASTALWFVLEGDATAAVAAGTATFIAALPLPYAVICWLTDRAARQALRKAKAGADVGILALLRDTDTLLFRRRLFSFGEPHLKELAPEGLSQAALLALAASAEQGIDHPYARVLCDVAEGRRLRLHRLSAASAVPHAGVEALLTGQTLRVGRLDWLADEGVHISAELLTRADQLSIHGLAIIGVSLGRRARGLIAFEEDLAALSKHAVQALSELHAKTLLLTHGSRRYSTALVKALGLTEARTYADEEGIVRELQLRKAHGSVVALVTQAGYPADAIEAAADLVLTIGTKKDEAAHSTRCLVLPSLSSLPMLMTAARRLAHAYRSSLRVALGSFLLLVLPSFGLLHAAGGPFVPPLVSGIGLLLLTLLSAVHFWKNR